MINDAGLTLLKEFERGRDAKTGKLLPVGAPATEAYDDGGGVWTISWGLTGPDIKKGTVWTPRKCTAEFNKRVEDFEAKVRAECTREPNENQLAAMVCLAFNIGIAAFKGSTVLRMHNAGKWAEAANAFSMWKKDNGVVLSGLVKRRAQEAALYIDPVDDTELSVRAVPQADDPGAKKWWADLDRLAAGTQQVSATGAVVVGAVAPVWDWINERVNPISIMVILGTAITVCTCYFMWAKYHREKAGDR